MTDQTFAVDISQEDNLPAFELGAKWTNPENQKTYRYVRAAAAKTIGLIYGIDEDFTVSATGAVKTEIHPLVGIPYKTSSAPASGFTYKHIWIQTAGNFARVEAAAASADNAQAFSTATAGKIDDGDDSGFRIRGLKFTAAAGSATNTTGYSTRELSYDGA